MNSAPFISNGKNNLPTTGYFKSEITDDRLFKLNRTASILHFLQGTLMLATFFAVDSGKKQHLINILKFNIISKT